MREADSYTSDNSILAKVKLLKIQFDKLNNLFRQVHLELSHSRHVDRQTANDIQNNIIDPYMAHYRALFPNKTLPKHHILEHHCTFSMKVFHFGCSFLSEQGTEASHQALAKISSRAVGINNEADRLRFVLSTHVTSVCPLIFKSTI